MTEGNHLPLNSLLCRLGLHRWTADVQQGYGELSAHWDCYCNTCHRDRFDERGIATTRLERAIDGIYVPVARLVYRIRRRLHRPPQYPTGLPTTVVVTTPPTEVATTTPVLIVSVNVKPPLDE